MFTDIFGSAPRVRLIDFLADHPAFDYTISQMAEFAEIARPTVYKLVDELVGQDMLTFTRSVGDSKFYRLNVANPRIVSMLQVDFEASTRNWPPGCTMRGPLPRQSPRSPAPVAAREVASPPEGVWCRSVHIRGVPFGERGRRRPIEPLQGLLRSKASMKCVLRASRMGHRPPQDTDAFPGTNPP